MNPRQILEQNYKNIVILAKFFIGFGTTGYLVLNSFYTVPAGHKAVIFNRLVGVKDEVESEGIHLMVPWFDVPMIFDIKTLPMNIQTLTGSKDLQMVNLTIRVLSKPNINRLPFIVRRIGTDYRDKVLNSIVNEVSKAIVAKFNAAELLTKRELVTNMISEHLKRRADEFGILLDDVSIVNLAFSAEYTAAVEAKQVAQQDAERSKYVVERALQEKKSIIIKAEGEATSAKLIGDAVKTNPSFIEMKKIDAAKEIADILSDSPNKIYLNSETLLLNVGNIISTPRDKK